MVGRNYKIDCYLSQKPHVLVKSIVGDYKKGVSRFFSKLTIDKNLKGFFSRSSFDLRQKLKKGSIAENRELQQLERNFKDVVQELQGINGVDSGILNSYMRRDDDFLRMNDYVVRSGEFNDKLSELRTSPKVLLQCYPDLLGSVLLSQGRFFLKTTLYTQLIGDYKKALAKTKDKNQREKSLLKLQNIVACSRKIEKAGSLEEKIKYEEELRKLIKRKYKVNFKLPYEGRKVVNSEYSKRKGKDDDVGDLCEEDKRFKESYVDRRVLYDRKSSKFDQVAITSTDIERIGKLFSMLVQIYVDDNKDPHTLRPFLSPRFRETEVNFNHELRLLMEAGKTVNGYSGDLLILIKTAIEIEEERMKRDDPFGIEERSVYFQYSLGDDEPGREEI